MIERIEINLLPAEYRYHKKNINIQREIAYPVLALVIIVAGIILWSLNLQIRISQCHNEISTLDIQIRQNRPIQNQINKLRDDKSVIQEKIKALERISVNREKWVRLMEELSGRLPEYTWLVSIKEESSTPPVLHIEGRTFSFPDVANYMSILKESEFVSDVDLSSIEQIDSKTMVYRFSISCVLNPDANISDFQDGLDKNVNHM